MVNIMNVLEEKEYFTLNYDIIESLLSRGITEIWVCNLSSYVYVSDYSIKNFKADIHIKPCKIKLELNKYRLNKISKKGKILSASVRTHDCKYFSTEEECYKAYNDMIDVHIFKLMKAKKDMSNNIDNIINNFENLKN